MRNENQNILENKAFIVWKVLRHDLVITQHDNILQCIYTLYNITNNLDAYFTKFCYVCTIVISQQVVYVHLLSL